MNWVESAEAIGEVDELLAAVGLEHGQRKTRVGAWVEGVRVRRGHKQIPVGDDKHRKAALPRKQDGPGVVRAAGWEKYAWLRHGFSTRHGGVSTVYSSYDESVGSSYDESAGDGNGELNLGWSKDDEAANVVENRRRFLAEVRGDQGGNFVGLRQFHSGMIRVVEQGTAGLRERVLEGAIAGADGRPMLRGDGLMTDMPGAMLGVGVADCVPVLVADVKRRAVAAFHAGWRGTLGRIVERGIGAMRLRYGSRPEDLIAAVGPSIGACCYSVGEEVLFEFESQFSYAPELFSEVYDSDPVRDKYPLLFLTARAPGHSNIGPQIHLDLWEANRRQLLDAGFKPGRITIVGECTACTLVGGRRKYFSHRGESGFAGRGTGMIGVA